MAYVLQENYGRLIDAKLRVTLATKDGVVFNTKYNDQANAGVVKIPVDEGSTVVSAYNRNNISANAVSYGSNSYIVADIDSDMMVNKYIDHADINALPYDKVANDLDEAGYALGMDQETKGVNTLVYAIQGKDKNGTAFASGDPRYGKTGTKVTATTDIFADLTKLGAALDTAGVPRDGQRYALVDPDTLADILNSSKAVKQGDLAQELVEKGVVSVMAGFNILVCPTLASATANSTLAAKVVAGHPAYATRISGWSEAIRLVDGNGDANVVGGAFLKGRKVYTQEVTKPQAFACVAA